jgi:neopullulanase
MLGCKPAPEPVSDTGLEEEPIAVRSCEVMLEHTPEVQALTIEVAGDFTDWEPEAMEGPDEDGMWRLSLGELAPGAYGYKFVYGGLWEESISGVETHWVNGVENRNLRVGDCQRPQIETSSIEASGDGQLTAHFQWVRAASGAALDPGSIMVTVGGVEISPVIDADAGTIAVDVTGLPLGKHSVHLWASDTAGAAIEEEPYFVPVWIEEEAFKWTDGLMYFPMLDRFRNGDYDAAAPICDPAQDVAEIANLQGGDLLGLIQAIEEGYLNDLGVRSVWLSPLYQNPDGGWYDRGGTILYSSYHGYWPIESREVETCLGDVNASADARLRELVQVAHDHGIRILLDLVLNHVHEDHPWVEAQPDWFNQSCVCGLDGCDWEERRLDCWFTDYLPDLNYREHALVTQAVADVTWWLEEYDVDGFRIDAAKHMDTVILNNIRGQLEEAVEGQGGAPLYLVGETFTGGDGHEELMRYVSDDQLHGQFDFPLMWSIRDSLIGGGSMWELDNKVQTGLTRYGDAIMSPFAGNHDVTRLATELSGGGWGPWANTPDYMAEGSGVVTQADLIDSMALIHAFTLTQPGVPLLYYGDEIGLAGDGDPDNRRRMNFEPYLSENQRALLAEVQAIGQARASSLPLRRGTHQTLWVDDDLYVYARILEEEVALVVLNKSEDPRSQVVPIPFAEWEGLELETLAGEEQSGGIESQQLLVEMGGRRYGFYRLSSQ